MADKRVDTLGDLARWAMELRITCGGCGRTRDIPAARLIGRFRADQRWKVIGRYMRCQGEDLVGGGCGHRGALVMLVTAPPEPPGATPPDGGGNVVPLRPRGIEPEHQQRSLRRVTGTRGQARFCRNRSHLIRPLGRRRKRRRAGS